jgi:hypothetical protein
VFSINKLKIKYNMGAPLEKQQMVSATGLASGFSLKLLAKNPEDLSSRGELCCKFQV